MSWASNNPTQYDKICIEGILTKMAKIIPNLDREKEREYLEDLTWDFMMDNVWTALYDWASEEINAAEADYRRKEFER